MKSTALLTTSIGNYQKRSGKVRDIYDLSEHLLIVATDRISAYDVVMANGIPDKGRVLTQISLFWFEMFQDLTANHVVSAEMDQLPEDCRSEELDGRFMLCRKAEVVPIECVVRGYLAGSSWREYLPEPIFTPATKAAEGHDENISFQEACRRVGREVMTELRDRSIALYERAAAYAAERGIIVADTKFEWGTDADGKWMLVDECLTPDSSRFWPAETYKPGKSQPSFDKQYVRDYLDEAKFDRRPPGPLLPAEVVQNTREKYIDAYTALTGRKFPWE